MANLYPLPKYEDFLGQYVKELRLGSYTLNTQTKLGEALHLRHATISRYENDNRENIPEIGYVAFLLKLRIEELEPDNYSIEAIQKIAIQEINLVIARHYARERKLRDWKQLCEIANHYVQIQEKKVEDVLGKLTVQKASIPVEVTDLKESEREAIFSFTFDDFPAILFENGEIDAVFVTGIGNHQVNLLSEEQRSLRMHSGAVKPISEFIYMGMFPAIAALYYSLGLSKRGLMVYNNSVHRLDTEIDEKIASQHNLITLSGGDVNLFTAKVFEEFTNKYGIYSPIRFVPTTTSDTIFSALSGKFYSERYESEANEHFCGMLVLLPNPWNEKKVILVAAGNRVLGTVATLKLLSQIILGQVKIKNHPNFADIPARIVTSKSLDESKKRVVEVEFTE